MSILISVGIDVPSRVFLFLFSFPTVFRIIYNSAL